jgi:hypothetical protein
MDLISKNSKIKIQYSKFKINYKKTFNEIFVEIFFIILILIWIFFLKEILIRRVI